MGDLERMSRSQATASSLDISAAVPVHPFPARMAPEFAIAQLPGEPCKVLDPMMGSGTIPVLAAMAGHEAIGYDLDPLALLIARTWGRPLPRSAYLEAALEVALEAAENKDAEVVAADSESQEFIERWFDPVARRRLAALAAEIGKQEASLQSALWCAFSRLIITKDAGASLARDVAHSRPHKVREKTNFDPIAKFVESASEVVRRHRRIGAGRPADAKLILEFGDARSLGVDGNSVDVVTTSPPYLIAIDYLRGHRMSLVWMGHSIKGLRSLRASAIGSERSATTVADHEYLLRRTLPKEASRRAFGVLRRYVNDLDEMMRESARVLRSGGTATFVVADATLFGSRVSIPDLVDHLAPLCGFNLKERSERELPADRRYLPPPTHKTKSSLRKRMRHEVCLRYVLD